MNKKCQIIRFYGYLWLCCGGHLVVCGSMQFQKTASHFSFFFFHCIKRTIETFRQMQPHLRKHLETIINCIKKSFLFFITKRIFSKLSTWILKYETFDEKKMWSDCLLAFPSFSKRHKSVSHWKNSSNKVIKSKCFIYV